MCGREFNLGETFFSMEDYDLYGRKIKLACCENLECVTGVKALLTPSEELGGKDVLHSLIDDKVRGISLKLSAYLSEPTTKNVARLREKLAKYSVSNVVTVWGLGYKWQD